MVVVVETFFGERFVFVETGRGVELFPNVLPVFFLQRLSVGFIIVVNWIHNFLEHFSWNSVSLWFQIGSFFTVAFPGRSVVAIPP